MHDRGRSRTFILGGRKRLCAHLQLRVQNRTHFWQGSRARFKGTGSSRVVLMLSRAIWALFFSILIKIIGLKKKKNIVYPIFFFGRAHPLPPPPGSATVKAHISSTSQIMFWRPWLAVLYAGFFQGRCFTIGCRLWCQSPEKVNISFSESKKKKESISQTRGRDISLYMTDLSDKQAKKQKNRNPGAKTKGGGGGCLNSLHMRLVNRITVNSYEKLAPCCERFVTGNICEQNMIFTFEISLCDPSLHSIHYTQGHKYL